MTAPQSVPEVLERAADYLAEHGKCGGTFRRGERRCIYGAVVEVLAPGFWFETSKMGWHYEAPIEIDRLIDTTLLTLDRRVPGGSVIGWSDRVSTKTAVSTLRDLANELRAAS